MLKGFKRNFKPLEILRDNEIQQIHSSVLNLLRFTGIRFECNEALKLFEQNGCFVDFKDMIVKFPEMLIEECLKKCPSSFRLRARNRDNDIVLGGDSVYFMSFPGMQTLDLDSWEAKEPSKKEYYDLITVLDSLDNLHIIGSYPYFGFKGINPLMILPECMAGKIRNSDKCLWGDYEKDSELFAIEMAKIVETDIMGVFMASPPLHFTENAYKAVKRFIEAGFPIAVLSGCVHGVSGPATIAGSLVTDTAELVAGIVLVQLLKPGTAIITNNFTFPANMKNGYHDFGGIGRCLHQAASNQIWKYYKIPKWNGAVGISNSKVIDFQCAYERTTAALIGAISGANVIQLHSGIYAELTAHPVQAILDDDIAGMIGRFLKGVDVNDMTLAIDLIKEVGFHSYFLDKEHTRDFWKQETYIPKVSDTLNYEAWKSNGKLTALDYAKRKMEEIITKHKVKTPLTYQQEESISYILKEAEKYYKLL
jgi:trimethylamine--corrinoid protein Co-methyltransferase